MKTSRVVSPNELKTQEPFENMFDIQPTVFQAIKEDMGKNGFDGSKPIDVWKGVVIDGHTRLRSARELGLVEIVIFEHGFLDEQEAIEYAICNQRNRRNLTNAEILRLVALLDRKEKQRQGERTDLSLISDRSRPEKAADRKSSARVAKTLGMSSRTVQKVIAINTRAPEEIKQAVAAKEKSFDKAYREITDSEPDGRQLMRSARKKMLIALDKLRDEDGREAALRMAEREIIEPLDAWREENYIEEEEWQP